MSVEYLVDTSAYMRLARLPELRDAWRPWFAAGTLAVCPLTELEIYYTAKSVEHRHQLRANVRRRYKWALMPDSIWGRAREIQGLLAERGAHRSAGPVDLLVAATAEANRMTVLHYDRDFVTVARVTGQPVRWIAEPGAID
jgi:predicted nucleic acid-binding protein